MRTIRAATNRAVLLHPALVGGLVIVGLLVGCSQSTVDSTTTSASSASTTSKGVSPLTTPSTAPTTSTTLMAEVGIEAPETWTEVGPSEYELPAIAGGLAPTMVQVEAEPMSDLDEAVTEAKSALQEIMRDFEVLSEGERVVGEYTARFLEYAGVDQGNVARYEVWIDRKDSLVHVIYSASVEAYTATKAEFEQTLVDSLG